jgi:putative oxidoreductase
MKTENRLPLALLLLRLSVFLVMFVWTVDKFVEPQHASKIMAAFYSIGGVGNFVIYLLATIELAVIVAFLLGFAKQWSYGLVLLMHAGSALASYKEVLTAIRIAKSSFFRSDSHVSSLLCALLSPGGRCFLDDQEKRAMNFAEIGIYSSPEAFGASP